MCVCALFCICCRTGEVEELNLQEIANEGHMSLIEPL
jgi:hypothetical protein